MKKLKNSFRTTNPWSNETMEISRDDMTPKDWDNKCNNLSEYMDDEVRENIHAIFIPYGLGDGFDFLQMYEEKDPEGFARIWNS